MGGIGLVLLLTIALALLIPPIHAAPIPRDNLTIGIQLSQSCLIMIKANITTTCPSYEQLYNLGLDDSLPGTGDFEYENGFFHRGPSQYKKVHELYRYNDYHIILDPPAEIASRTKLITINPDLPLYTLDKRDLEKINHVRTLHKDRYVEDCHKATITSKNWSDLLADTIYYLRNNCTHTVFDTRVIYEDHISTMDITTSQKYKHDKWVKESIEKCKTQICKEY